MRGSLFKSKGISENIFKNERFLYPEFLPERLPHRDDELSEIARALKPLLSKSKPRNLFIFGPPGVGKTASCKFVLRELKENSNAYPIYLNCWEYDTRHAILTQLSYKLGSFAPRRGTATDEVYEKFVEGLKRSGRDLVIILDEIDKLLIKDGPKAIYDLVRQATGRFVSLILISNDKYALRRLDDRTKSSLNHEELFFDSYKKEQLKDILSVRVENAFRKGKVDKGVIESVSQFTAENGGDVRLGLECLLRAGQSAKGTLSLEDVRGVLNAVKKVRLKESLRGISKEHKNLILTIATLTGKGDITSGVLFEKHSEMGNDIAERTFRKYISELEELNFIKTRMSGEGFRGKTRIIELRSPAALTKDVLS
jgi:cell division control protein 6